MRINTIVKGFVDLNLEKDENVKWSYVDNKIFFTSVPTTVISGNHFSFKVNLQKPSPYGIEEIQLYFSGTAIITNSENMTSPIYLKYDKGESGKTLTFLTSNDGVVNFSLKSPKNVDVILGDNKNINII